MSNDPLLREVHTLRTETACAAQLAQVLRRRDASSTTPVRMQLECVLDQAVREMTAATQLLGAIKAAMEKKGRMEGMALDADIPPPPPTPPQMPPPTPPPLESSSRELTVIVLTDDDEDDDDVRIAASDDDDIIITSYTAPPLRSVPSLISAQATRTNTTRKWKRRPFPLG